MVNMTTKYLGIYINYVQTDNYAAHLTLQQTFTLEFRRIQ